MHGDINFQPLNIAIIGSGISGLSASWLLSQRHNITLYEAGAYLGGHSNTVDIIDNDTVTPVDTGFIVYNEPAYPNLTRFFQTLNVDTNATEMSFAVSIDNGSLEYAGNGFNRIFAQRENLLNYRYWRMLGDIIKFYKIAPRDAPNCAHLTLAEYLHQNNFSAEFCQLHLYPMAAAIWSIPARQAGHYPFKSFIDFCSNHGLLQIRNRPIWRTVKGGSREYVKQMSRNFQNNIRLNNPVKKVIRYDDHIEVISHSTTKTYDHVVFACHADQALALIAEPSDSERALLANFKYSTNKTYLHGDKKLMPKRDVVWSSWNYLTYGAHEDSLLTVTYWMNALQNLPTKKQVFVTLNPHIPPDEKLTYREFTYEHPILDRNAISAQEQLWSLQGLKRTWYCGSYFGAGFHEDGLQSGLAVAEQLGGYKRPWTVENESGRITVKALRGQTSCL